MLLHLLYVLLFVMPQMQMNSKIRITTGCLYIISFAFGFVLAIKTQKHIKINI